MKQPAMKPNLLPCWLVVGAAQRGAESGFFKRGLAGGGDKEIGVSRNRLLLHPHFLRIPLRMAP
jgi:hypothetical protein